VYAGVNNMINIPNMDQHRNGNRRLTVEERAIGRQILKSLRAKFQKAAGDDPEMAWALRRFVYARLIYDERGTPMQRRRLNRLKRVSQKNRCAGCARRLPSSGAELDRSVAMKGYTEENTRLVCHRCHRMSQKRKGFT